MDVDLAMDEGYYVALNSALLVANAQVREFQRATFELEDLPKPSRIRIDFHGINHDIVERKLSARNIKQIFEHLHWHLTETESELTVISDESQALYEGDFYRTIATDIQMLATTPLSPEEVERMIDGESDPDTQHRESASSIPFDANSSNSTFDIEYLVQLDSEYLLTLFSGGTSFKSGKDHQATATVMGHKAEDKPDDDAWDPDDL
ncbi:hypothetical protein FRC03_012486 [Tulasnella sp. 419]|nr:hypothetical protein FRC03_012486 [Tulasnella sp. 419]